MKKSVWLVSLGPLSANTKNFFPNALMFCLPAPCVLRNHWKSVILREKTNFFSHCTRNVASVSYQLVKTWKRVTFVKCRGKGSSKCKLTWSWRCPACHGLIWLIKKSSFLLTIKGGTSTAFEQHLDLSSENEAKSRTRRVLLCTTSHEQELGENKRVIVPKLFSCVLDVHIWDSM